MHSFDCMEVAERAMKQIKRGAFLTVKAGDDLNTMTIGYALIGYMWQRPIFTLGVRKSRYTHSLIIRAVDFTVSVPMTDMFDQIRFCGTRSGRDVNKYAKLNLKVKDAQQTVSPIIDTPGIHFECSIIYKTAMDKEQFFGEHAVIYPEGDYHTLFFGEILECYETE